MTAITKKLHLQHPYLKSAETIVTAIHETEGIVTESTIAFAESGGQEGDRGKITIMESNTEVTFLDTQNGQGRPLNISDFHSIHVNVPVYHRVSEEDLGKFKVGQRVVVEIDTERRANLTSSHSCIHLGLMGLEQRYPDIYGRIRGCHIKEDSARLDFVVDDKMTSEDFEFANEFVNQLVQDDHSMLTYAHPDESEAYYWQLGDTIYPCGGTHLPSTGTLGEVQVSKKNLGKNAQRLIVKFPNHKPLVEPYYSHLKT